MHRGGIMNELAAKQQEQTDNEELIAKAIAQQDARQAQQQKEKDDKRMAMLDSIASHREAMVWHVHPTTSKETIGSSKYYSHKIKLRINIYQ